MELKISRRLQQLDDGIAYHSTLRLLLTEGGAKAIPAYLERYTLATLVDRWNQLNEVREDHNLSLCDPEVWAEIKSKTIEDLTYSIQFSHVDVVQMDAIETRIMRACQVVGRAVGLETRTRAMLSATLPISEEDQPAIPPVPDERPS